MLKVVWLMKRKDGTSFSDLVDFYETKHSILAKDLFRNNDFALEEHETRFDDQP